MRIQTALSSLAAVAAAGMLFVGADGSALAQSGSRTRSTVVPRGTVQQPASGSMQRGAVSGSGTTTTAPAQASGTTVAAKKSYEMQLWDYLQAAKYQNWAPVPGKSDGNYEGQSPHGAFLKMYLNRRAAGNPKTLPNGSLVIKENYGKDGKTLMAITVMVRAKGYNPSAGDWYWIKYRPDGTVDQMETPMGKMALAGKPKGCIECHGGADGEDFLFFNDDLE